MTKTYYKVLTAIFVVFIGALFCINLFTKDRDFSDVENRKLAQKPTFTFEKLFKGAFTADYEKYITDQFFARDTWVGLKYYSERSMLKTENNGVYFGKDDYLINKFKTPEEERVAGNFTSIQKFIDSNTIPTYFSLVPTSAYVLRDKLPANATPFEQQVLFDRAGQSFPDNYIDISAALVDNNKGYLYYRTDHHWTSDGAYVAYRTLCEQWGLTPFLRGEKAGEYPNFYGTLYSNAGARNITPDTVVTYKVDGVTVTDFEGKEIPLYDTSFGTQKDKYSVFFGGNHPVAVVKNQNLPEGEKLLLIKDSFSNALVPYLSQNFSEIHMIDLRFNKSSLAEYIDNNHIDVALVLYSTENFATDTNLFILGK